MREILSHFKIEMSELLIYLGLGDRFCIGDLRERMMSLASWIAEFNLFAKFALYLHFEVWFRLQCDSMRRSKFLAPQALCSPSRSYEYLLLWPSHLLTLCFPKQWEKCKHYMQSSQYLWRCYLHLWSFFFSFIGCSLIFTNVDDRDKESVLSSCLLPPPQAPPPSLSKSMSEDKGRQCRS